MADAPGMEKDANQQEADRGLIRETEPANLGAFKIWIPWALAASLLIFCGILAVDRAKMERRLLEQRGTAQTLQPVLVVLGPSEGNSSDAKVVVAWEPVRQSGVIKVSNLPVAGPGKDYQLWAVDAAHANPISAGIVRVDPNGVAQVRFKPVAPAQQVKAFAITVEREGGVPKAEGPIILVGTT